MNSRLGNCMLMTAAFVLAAVLCGPVPAADGGAPFDYAPYIDRDFGHQGLYHDEEVGII